MQQVANKGQVKMISSHGNTTRVTLGTNQDNYAINSQTKQQWKQMKQETNHTRNTGARGAKIIHFKIKVLRHKTIPRKGLEIFK